MDSNRILHLFFFFLLKQIIFLVGSLGVVAGRISQKIEGLRIVREDLHLNI